MNNLEAKLLSAHKVVKAYEEYIELLGQELHEVVPIATVHGWKSSRVKAGKAARRKINKFKKELEESL